MIDTASTSQPPLWPSVGALLVSGWVGGVVATILWAPLLGATRFGSVFTPGVLTATWLAPTLAGVLVASALLPRLLRAFCEFELGLGSAFVVTLGRSLAGFAASTFFTATVPTAGHADVRDVLPPARDPFARGRLPAPEAAEPVPRLARSGPVAQRRLEQPEASAPRAATGEWEHLLAAVRIEVAQTLSSTSGRPHGAAATGARSNACAVSTRSTARWRNSTQSARTPSSGSPASPPDTPSSSAAFRQRLS